MARRLQLFLFAGSQVLSPQQPVSHRRTTRRHFRYLKTKGGEIMFSELEHEKRVYVPPTVVEYGPVIKLTGS